MTATVNISDLIASEAALQGVPASVALGVAKVESGISQWTAGGQVVTSPKGALGVFQLMPATAAQLGVDPTDVSQNIQGGITYLAQLYQKYGDWNTALAAYNFGPGNVDAGKSLPSETVNYVKAVLGISGGSAASAAVEQSLANPPATSEDVLASVVPGGTPTIAAAALAGIGLLIWWLRD